MVYLWCSPSDFKNKNIGEYNRKVSPDRFLLKEGRKLKSLGELPENVKINENLDLLEKENEDDLGIDIIEDNEDVDDDEDNLKQLKEQFKSDFDQNFKYI